MVLIVEGYRKFTEWWQTRAFLRPSRADELGDPASVTGGQRADEVDCAAVVACEHCANIRRSTRIHARVTDRRQIPFAGTLRVPAPAAQRSRMGCTGPAARTPAESPQPFNALWRARCRSPGEQDSTSGPALVVSSGRRVSGRPGGRGEQEFRQAKEAAEAEAAEDAQGAPQREARRQEARLRHPFVGRQVEPRRSAALPGSIPPSGAGMRVTGLGARGDVEGCRRASQAADARRSAS